HEEEDDERRREARLADVPPERDVVRATLLQDEDDDEDERNDHRRAEPEVRPLLREQLRELPAVDGRDGAHATASALSELSPSVSPRNSSSRLATSGTSAVTGTRAWPSATESAPTASSAAWKRSSPSCCASSWTPACASATTRARSIP